jgi:hypothetical protein
LFVDGIAQDKILGFDGLADNLPAGMEDSWPTVKLARLLADKRMLRRDLIVDEDKETQAQAMAAMRKAMMAQTFDDDELDLDD